MPLAELRTRSFEAVGEGAALFPIGRREAARLALNLLSQGHDGDECAVDTIGLLLDARISGNSRDWRDALGRDKLIAELYQPLHELSLVGQALNPELSRS